MNRGQLPARSLPTRPNSGDCPERTSGRTTICRNTPSNIMPPARSQPEPRAEVSLGVRGHTPPPQRAHAPPHPDPVPPASMPAGDPLTHTAPVPQKPSTHPTPLTTPPGQVSDRARDARFPCDAGRNAAGNEMRGPTRKRSGTSTRPEWSSSPEDQRCTPIPHWRKAESRDPHNGPLQHLVETRRMAVIPCETRPRFSFPKPGLQASRPGASGCETRALVLAVCLVYIPHLWG